MFHVKQLPWRLQVELNHHLGLRSPLFYPLNYGDLVTLSRKIIYTEFSFLFLTLTCPSLQSRNSSDNLDLRQRCRLGPGPRVDVVNIAEYLLPTSRMPTKHAAIKDLRKTRKRAARNLRLKTHAKQLLKKAETLLKEGKVAEAKAVAHTFQQIADKAAKQRVMTRNAINRKKSSLMRAIAKAK